jgi:hypothetical protein
MVFLALFTILTFIGLNINFSPILGLDEKSFTLFQFFGPIAGGFLGIGGIAVVFIAKLFDAVLTGSSLGLIDLLKLTPMAFAAYYFWKKGLRGIEDKIGIVIPAIAMIAFWLHPVGSQTWYYALYWLIPIAARFLPQHLILRSLGATFMAHCVGSVLFLYTIPTTAALWAMLIPIVAIERGLFAIGIAGSYVVFTNILESMDKTFQVKKFLNIEKDYLIRF